MLSLDSQAVSSRPYRSLLAGMLLGVALTLGACNGADSPLAPSDSDQATAASAEPGASEATAAGDALLVSASERIVFTSWRMGNAETYKMDPQGMNVVRLTTTTSAEERDPIWSYDMKRIVMMRKRTDSGITHDDIWVMNADGSNGHWVRPTPSPWNLWNPSFSPDGSHLLLTVSVMGYVYLGTMTLTDGQVTLIHPVGGGILGLQPQYDRTGQKIVYVDTYNKRIIQVNADGTNPKVLATTSNIPNRPSFSPDGKKIAYSADLPGTLNEEVFVKNLVTQATTRLTFSSGPDFYPTWSHDGSKIAFVSERSGHGQVYVVSATGGSSVRITHTSTMEGDPFWSY